MAEPAPGPYDHLTDQEKQALVVGKCNFLALSLLSTTAFVLSGTAAGYCDFADRDVTFVEGFDVPTACANLNLTDWREEVCNTFFNKHGVGFYGWYATVPVDTQVCTGYEVFIPNKGYIIPDFDAAFKAAAAFSIIANICGMFGWFTIMFSTCCPIDNGRLKGVSCYYTLAYICQAFTFLIFASNVCEKGFLFQYFRTLEEDDFIDNVTCSLGTGAKASVAATVMYFVCSLLAPVSLAPLPIGYRPVPPPEAQTTDNYNEAAGP